MKYKQTIARTCALICLRLFRTMRPFSVSEKRNGTFFTNACTAPRLSFSATDCGCHQRHQKRYENTCRKTYCKREWCTGIRESAEPFPQEGDLEERMNVSSYSGTPPSGKPSRVKEESCLFDAQRNGYESISSHLLLANQRFERLHHCLVNFKLSLLLGRLGLLLLHRYLIIQLLVLA